MDRPVFLSHGDEVIVAERWTLLTALSLACCACTPDRATEYDWGTGAHEPEPAGSLLAPPPAPPKRQDVPHPITLLLPKDVQIDAFTGMRTFDRAGGVRGIDVRVKALDHYDTVTKAFGVFRFELYAIQPNNANRRGKLLSRWIVDLSDPRDNVKHWEDIPPCYKFRLKWSRPIPVGRRFLLAVVFSSPFTERKFAERVFVAGE